MVFCIPQEPSMISTHPSRDSCRTSPAITPREALADDTRQPEARLIDEVRSTGSSSPRSVLFPSPQRRVEHLDPSREQLLRYRQAAAAQQNGVETKVNQLFEGSSLKELLVSPPMSNQDYIGLLYRLLAWRKSVDACERLERRIQLLQTEEPPLAPAETLDSGGL